MTSPNPDDGIPGVLFPPTAPRLTEDGLSIKIERGDAVKIRIVTRDWGSNLSLGHADCFVSYFTRDGSWSGMAWAPSIQRYGALSPTLAKEIAEGFIGPMFARSAATT